jgi:hypothetical protein
MRTSFVTASLSFIGLAACSDTVCEPGATQACTCTDGDDGAQSCLDDGSGWAECRCSGEEEPDGGEADAGSSTDGGAVGGDGDGDGLAGIDFMERFVGNWSGPADSSTALGDFQIMTMDARPLDDRTLFARGDLDALNSIRFLFTVETINGAPQLVYRNGGAFLGALRDSRTTIESYDESTGTYRFCAVAGGFCNSEPGCDYIDAIWQFDGEDRVSLDVTVCGMHHVTWDAERIETRDAPAPFPVDASPTGDGTGPFPPMPTVDVTMTFSAAAGGESLLLSLSDEPCPLNPLQPCNVSRTFLVELDAAQTEATFTLEQIHPGSYAVNALLDRDGNLFPSNGDHIAAPNGSLVIDDNEETLDVSVTVPVNF